MRFFDVLISGLALILLAPLFLLIGVLIKLDSQGPVFHRAKRVGQGGATFTLYKFRSMLPNADRRGPGITVAGDGRVTHVGRVLRRTKLDELPQLWNVFKGEMSLVGPRPEDPRYVALYTPEQRRVLAVKPGITSAASLTFRHEEQLLVGRDWEAAYRNEVLPTKLAIDLDYLSERTLRSDIELVLRTIKALFE